MAIDLINCDRSLNVLIQTEADPPNISWQNFFFDFIDDYTLTLSNTPHSHNTSYAWDITDHVKRDKDVLTLNGTMSCVGCGPREVRYFNGVEEEIKFFKERMLFRRNTMARITLPDFLFTNAVLVNATVKNTHAQGQRKNITMTFHGYNFSGLTFKPSSITGGVDSLRIRNLSSDAFLV